ncbi:Aminopeptidase 2 mitochondrial [Borealophlyctis nickersoniae]|nr:Aminopeptidase 2 mitochondrial [Borealophlyctis nickersoniae]
MGKAVEVGVPEVVGKAKEFFKALKGGKREGWDKDVLQVVLDAGVMWGNEDDYEWVLESYMNATSNLDRSRYLQALAASPEPYLQQRTLEMALSGKVRKQDVVRLISLVSFMTPTGHTTTWSFLLDSFPAFVAYFGKDTDWTRFNDLLTALSADFLRKWDADLARRLFVDRSVKDVLAGWDWVPERSDLAVKKGLEKCEGRMAWINKWGAEVGKWLEDEAAV